LLPLAGMECKERNEIDMLIITAPICPRCHEAIMSRHFSTFEKVAMVLLLLMFFPFAVWIYLTPRYLFCRNCGNKLAEVRMP